MRELTGEQEKTGRRVLVLGTFDGVHLGHRELLRQGKLLSERTGAPLRVYTFDRHPLEELFPRRAPGLLTDSREKAAKMAEFGVDELRILRFDRDMARRSPQEFLQLLRAECDPCGVVAGWNYTFGRNREGNADTLRADGLARGCETVIVPSVTTEEGEVISSSAIREKLTVGDIQGANAMLGFPFSLSGEVVRGKHMGSRIGVPTANIRPEERKLLPARGVYVCEMICGSLRREAVVNIGLQPTLPSGQETVEAHIVHGTADLYGARAEIRLLERLRGEIRFGSVEELKEQIRRDIAETEVFFGKKSAGTLP